MVCENFGKSDELYCNEFVLQLYKAVRWWEWYRQGLNEIGIKELKCGV